MKRFPREGLKSGYDSLKVDCSPCQPLLRRPGVPLPTAQDLLPAAKPIWEIKRVFIHRGAAARRHAFSLQTDLIPDSFQPTSTDAPDDQQFLHPSKRRILLSILQNALRGRFTNSRKCLQFFERCLVDIDSLRCTTLCARDFGCLKCGRRLARGTLPGRDGEKQSQHQQGIPDHWLIVQELGSSSSVFDQFCSRSCFSPRIIRRMSQNPFHPT